MAPPQPRLDMNDLHDLINHTRTPRRARNRAPHTRRTLVGSLCHSANHSCDAISIPEHFGSMRRPSTIGLAHNDGLPAWTVDRSLLAVQFALGRHAHGAMRPKKW